MPAVEQHETRALTSLQRIVNSGAFHKEEMKLPLFVCISELFLVYTEVASGNSGHDLRFPDLEQSFNMTLTDLREYSARERERRESALEMCKQLAGLYTFLFSAFVPFGGKCHGPSSKNTQTQWAKLDDWLQKGGVVDEGERIEIRAVLADYVRKMRVAEDWGVEWSPGQMLWGPEVFKQICDFRW